MKFEFDARKNASNKASHGISLDEATALWVGEHIIIPARNVSEPRFAIIGWWKGRLHVAIFTKRGEYIRIISCHPADNRWKRTYYEVTKSKI